MEKVVASPVQHSPSNQILQNFVSKKNSKKKQMLVYIVIGLAVILAGTATGKVLSAQTPSGSTEYSGAPNTPAKTNQNEMGVADEGTFKDSAEGKLVKGGIEGEGTYHLERSGGKSQYVYLTSTIVELSGFEGKNVKVWGQTLSGKKAGWLMDVGRIKVLE